MAILVGVMNEIQKKSLELIDKLFSDMDADTFLREYEAVELNIGPTIDYFMSDDFLKSNHFNGSFVPSYVIDIECEFLKTPYEIVKPLVKGENCIYAQNDEIYYLDLAA